MLPPAHEKLLIECGQRSASSVIVTSRTMLIVSIKQGLPVCLSVCTNMINVMKCEPIQCMKYSCHKIPSFLCMFDIQYQVHNGLSLNLVSCQMNLFEIYMHTYYLLQVPFNIIFLCMVRFPMWSLTEAAHPLGLQPLWMSHLSGSQTKIRSFSSLMQATCPTPISFPSV